MLSPDQEPAFFVKTYTLPSGTFTQTDENGVMMWSSQDIYGESVEIYGMVEDGAFKDYTMARCVLMDLGRPGMDYDTFLFGTAFVTCALDMGIPEACSEDECKAALDVLADLEFDEENWFDASTLESWVYDEASERGEALLYQAGTCHVLLSYDHETGMCLTIRKGGYTPSEMTEEEEYDNGEDTGTRLYGADVPVIEAVFPDLSFTLPETAEELRALFDIDNMQRPALDYKSIYTDLMDDGKASFEAPEGLIDFGVLAMYRFSNGEFYIELGMTDEIKDGVAACTVADEWLGKEFLALRFWMVYQSESYIDEVIAVTDKLAENVTDSTLTRSVAANGSVSDFVGSGFAMYKDALMGYSAASYYVTREGEGEEAQFYVNLFIATDVVLDEDGVIMDETMYRWMRSYDAAGNPIDGSDEFITTDPSYPAV